MLPIALGFAHLLVAAAAIADAPPGPNSRPNPRPPPAPLYVRTSTPSEPKPQAPGKIGPTRSKRISIDPLTFDVPGAHARASFASADLGISLATPNESAALLFRLRAGYQSFPGFQAFVNARFVSVLAPRDNGESILQIEDLLFSGGYAHQVELGDFGIGMHKLELTYRLSMIAPTSRLSRASDLRTSLLPFVSFRVNVIDRLVVGSDLTFRYNFHKFAEQAGFDNGLNIRHSTAWDGIVEYTPINSELGGTLTLGGRLGGDWSFFYPTVRSTFGDPSRRSLRSINWSLYALYTLPKGYMSFRFSVTQRRPLYDGGFSPFIGIAPPFVLALTFIGRY